MQHDINPGNVKWVATRLNDAIGNGQFSRGEAILGIAEFMGRFIVSVADTPVSGFQVAEVMENQIKATLVAGYTSKGFNMGSSHG